MQYFLPANAPPPPFCLLTLRVKVLPAVEAKTTETGRRALATEKGSHHTGGGGDSHLVLPSAFLTRISNADSQDLTPDDLGDISGFASFRCEFLLIPFFFFQRGQWSYGGSWQGPCWLSRCSLTVNAVDPCPMVLPCTEDVWTFLSVTFGISQHAMNQACADSVVCHISGDKLPHL